MRTAAVAAAAAVLAGQALAHPVVGEEQNLQARAPLNLEKYRQEATSSYTSTKARPGAIKAISGASGSYTDTAEQVVKKVAKGAEYRMVNDHYKGSNGIAHVHFKQVANGLDIDNANFQVNIAPDGSVLSYSNNFFKGQVPAASDATDVDAVTALKGVGAALGLDMGADGASVQDHADGEGLKEIHGSSTTQGKPEAKLVYYVKNNKLVKSWRLETDMFDDWLLSYVDAATGKEVQGVTNYKVDADQSFSYNVFPWGINDPTEGGRELQKDPWTPWGDASPLTWQNDGKAYTTTEGNNGHAQANFEGDNNWQNDYRPDAGQNGTFDYPLDLNADPKTNKAASVTQLWYTANTYHDLLYILGFDEKAGNFQTNNADKGGKGNDAVILNALDGSGTNNANFATPPDGKPGRMRMYIWDTNGAPKRDCAFEAGVIIHEYTHGLSTRLTGGPANSNCLNALESGGMGEGWGDFMATAIRINSTDNRDKDQTLGAWVFNDPKGIRDYPYSTDMKRNPLTYGSLDKLNEVHAIGTAWCNILFETLWNIIDDKGNTDENVPQLDDKGVPKDGRFQTMKIVADAMALQPCNPNMVQARDAILDADKAATDGSNECNIWKAFAKRGLGTGAKYGKPRTENFDTPKQCGGDGPTPTPTPGPAPTGSAGARRRALEHKREVRWA